MKIVLIILLITSIVMQAAESSIENPPSAIERAAAIQQVKANYEEECKRLKQKLATFDYDKQALPRNKLLVNLTKAVRNDDSISVKKLLKSGISANDLNKQLLLQETTKPDIIRLLLEYKADVNALSPFYGVSPLAKHCYIAQTNRLNWIECAQILLECPNIAVNTQDKLDGHTPFIQLIQSDFCFNSIGFIPLITKLLDRGADPYINNLYQENAYNLLEQKLKNPNNYSSVRNVLRACVAQRNVVATAVNEHLSQDTSGLVMLYAWGNLHNLLKKAEVLVAACQCQKTVDA